MSNSLHGQNILIKMKEAAAGEPISFKLITRDLTESLFVPKAAEKGSILVEKLGHEVTNKPITKGLTTVFFHMPIRHGDAVKNELAEKTASHEDAVMFADLLENFYQGFVDRLTDRAMKEVQVKTLARKLLLMMKTYSMVENIDNSPEGFRII